MTERIIPYRRQTTIERYRGIIEREIIPGLGHLDIARLGPGEWPRTRRPVRTSECRSAPMTMTMTRTW